MGEKKDNLTASVSSINRRKFLKRLGILGGGVVVYITFDRPIKRFGKRLKRVGRRFVNKSDDFNAFLRIGADGRVACFTGKIEMGQGIVTALSQTIADELDVSYDSIDMVMGDTDLCPWDSGTSGSRTIRYFAPMLRDAAAEARAVLLELASENLKTPINQLTVKDGVISDRNSSNKRVSYADLTKGKNIERHLKNVPALKAVSELKLMGNPFLKRDALEKVTGKTKFAGDIQLPGMLYAKILRPPAHGAKFKNVDTSEAKKARGAVVIEDNELIAVLHEQPDEAKKILKTIKAEYILPETNLNDRNVFNHLINNAPRSDVVSKGGALETGRKLAADIFTNKYLHSYVAHAPIETHTSVAEVRQGKATIWASTQKPFGIKEKVASSLGFDSEDVRIITPFVGGGFGGKNSNQEAVEAARLAKLSGKPVQVAWSREEEFFYDRFGRAAVVTITSGIDAAGNVVLWDYVVYFAGPDSSKQFYDIPHHKEVSRRERRWWPRQQPLMTGPWRAPGSNTNTFARESQIDIMASKIGVDPLKFRLDHLSNKKMRRVLEVAADKFNWTSSKSPSGRGVGVACSIRSGTYVATMAEVEVDRKTGHVRVERVVCVQDMGFSVNPQGAKLQMEGCVTMGLGYALTEEVRFANGKIFNQNFDTYDIPRFSWLPKIETVIIEDKNSPPQGGGEPPIVCMGAVLANAIFDATGARLYQLPMTPVRIRQALTETESSQ